MDPLSTLWETFFDWDSMRQALPEMLTVGLPNTLILAVTAALLKDRTDTQAPLPATLTRLRRKPPG